MAGLDNEEIIEPPGGTPPVPPVPPPAPAPRVIGHGGEIPPERVSELRANERRKFNKETYGTEDEEEVARIKAKNSARLKKADELEAEAEKARLASLSEADRLKEELRVEREQRTTEKTKLERERDVALQSLEVERQDVLITGLASKYVGPKFLKLAKVEFGEYVDGLTKAQLKELTQPAIDKWFAKFVKENPEYKPAAPAVAKTAEEIAEEEKLRAARPPAVPPRRAPVGAPRPGARPPVPAPRPASGPGIHAGKKVKDMTPKELDAFYKANGRRKPY